MKPNIVPENAWLEEEICFGKAYWRVYREKENQFQKYLGMGYVSSHEGIHTKCK